MHNCIIEVTTKAGTRRMLLTGGEPVSIGWDPANSLAFRDDKLSHFHCEIEKRDGSFTLRDLDSETGTALNGKRIREAILQSGDVIEVGRIKVKYLEMKSRKKGSGRSHGGEQPSSPTPKKPAKKISTAPEPAPPETVTADHGGDSAADSAPMSREEEPSTPVGPPRRGMVLNGPGEDVETPAAAEPVFATELAESTPADDINQAIKAGQDHEQKLRQMIGSVSHKTLDASAIALINGRGQMVHAPADEDVRTAVRSGRDGVLFLRTLLLLCLQIRATDLHIEPKGDDFQIRVRVDGMMVGVLQMHSMIAQRLLRLVKVLCDIDITQASAIQEGHFRTDVPGRRIDYRVSFTPAIFGQKLVIRVLDLLGAPTHLNNLGLPAWMAKDVGRVIRQDAGMVLMCGPTGSGKTTTLYALIRDIDASLRNIVTIEDPVEYQIEGVTQIPINEAQGNSFSNLLRSVLRQDPDVILVGEIRDPETARIAMQAAITGHLVFSTVHAQDGIGTIFRLLDLGVETHLVASGLNLVLAQRLVRKLCPSCKRAHRLSPGQAMRIGRYGIENVSVVYQPVGCAKCLKTGYIGRRAIFELVTATNDLKDVILAGSAIQDIRKIIRSSLFASLHESGYRLVSEGETSIEEIERVVGGE